MTNSYSARIAALAGLPVNEDAMDQAIEREKMIIAHVEEVCHKLRILLADVEFPINYEIDENLVTIVLDDPTEGTSIKHLAGLYRSGMSNDYLVRNHDDQYLEVVFTWTAN